MIEITTPKTNAIQETKSEIDPNLEELNTEDQSFYSSIVPDLNALLEDPNPEIINKIVNYSKSV
ncbi:hypothetical protein [Daejeonella sp.]|jgi:hypothetical protein|uniref:hypothetical protein n=1 Tax=Daejeonella sp. TaxID=2805397 RepID=UPI0037BFAF0A